MTKKKTQREKIKEYQEKGYRKFYGTDGRVYLSKPGSVFKNGKFVKGRIIRVDAEGEVYSATWKFKRKLKKRKISLLPARLKRK